MSYTGEETILCLSCDTGRILVNSDACLFILHDNLMFVIARKLSSLDFCCVTSIYSILSSLLCCSEEINLCSSRILLWSLDSNNCQCYFKEGTSLDLKQFSKNKAEICFLLKRRLTRMHTRTPNTSTSPNNDTI